MNILHFKYAVEVARASSFTRAAENLYMGQPSLSRAIKELEDNIGITIFKRTSKGIVPTLQGEEFLKYAYGIVNQIQEVESMYKSDRKHKLEFRVSVPRSSYISYAFRKLVAGLELTKEIDFYYKETNSLKAINNILQNNYNLGIIRYPKVHEDCFKHLLKEKDLKSESIWEFDYVVLLSKHHQLADKENISYADLKKHIQIVHGDPYVPFLPLLETKKTEFINDTDKKINIYERGSQFELLSDVENSYMWCSPVPPKYLKRYSLIQRKCKDTKLVYKDVLIYQKNYKFSNIDNSFLEELKKSRDKVAMLKIQ